MRRVAFYLENGRVSDVDLCRPELGNPGCGGTEYLFAATPYFLKVHQEAKCEPIILAQCVRSLPRNVRCLAVENVLEAARLASQQGCDYFVYRPRRQPNTDLLALIDSLKLPTIAWLHITPLDECLRGLARAKYVRAVVCVEREQHDLAQDTAVWSKLTCIVNGFCLNDFRLEEAPSKEQGLVVYLGALVPQKGFRLLAMAWPEILGRHPRARLAVVGNGALYGAKSEFGPWGIAEKEYEMRYIVPYLRGSDGSPHPSVRFLGKMGLEKKELLSRAMVGVVNPSGQTENCPGSALEFQASGTAVVSGAYYGVLDTVKHGETGLLGRGLNELVENICHLLENPEKAQELGQNGVKFVGDRYNFVSVTAAWCELFDRIGRNERPRRIPFKTNLYQHSKFLIRVNRIFQRILGEVLPWPSVVQAKVYLANLSVVRRFLRRG